MERRALAAMLALALAGCAHGRAADPRQPAPVGIHDVPPVGSTINGGVPNPEPFDPPGRLSGTPEPRNLRASTAPRDREAAPAAGGTTDQPPPLRTAQVERQSPETASSAATMREPSSSAPSRPKQARPPEEPKEQPSTEPATSPNLEQSKGGPPEPAPNGTAGRAAADPHVKPANYDDQGGMSMRTKGFTEGGIPAAGVAAVVGNTVITIRELREALAERTWKDQIPYSQLSDEQKGSLHKVTLDDMIDRTLILQRARKELKDKQWQALNELAEKLWKDEGLRDLVREYKVADEGALRKKLEEQKGSLSETKQSYKEQMMAKEMAMMKVHPKVEKPSLPELRAYYQAHLKDFDRPAAVTWREILIPLPENGDRNSARVRAEAIRERLLKGEDFGRVAKAESAGANAAKGGLWEWTSLGGHAVAEVNKGLETLAPGQISAPIESPQGYRIVRVDARRSAGPQPFDDRTVQKKIEEIIFKQHYEKAMDTYINELRATTLIRSPLFRDAGKP